MLLVDCLQNQKNMLLVVPPRDEKNAKLGKACLASEGTCSIKASASNGTQRKQQAKISSKFPTEFSKGSCPKEIPQRAAQQGDQPIACTREVDQKMLPIKSPAVSGEHATAKTTKIHRTAAVCSSSAGGSAPLVQKVRLITT